MNSCITINYCAASNIDLCWCGCGLSGKRTSGRIGTKQIGAGGVDGSSFPAIGGVERQSCRLVSVDGRLAAGIGGGTLLALTGPTGLQASLVDGPYYCGAVTLVQ